MGEAGVRVQKEANDSDEWDKQAYLHSECSLNAPGPTETTGEGVGSVQNLLLQYFRTEMRASCTTQVLAGETKKCGGGGEASSREQRQDLQVGRRRNQRGRWGFWLGEVLAKLRP